MRILIHDDAAGAADRVARMIAARLAVRPASVLGLATGGTMEAVYARVIALCGRTTAMTALQGPKSCPLHEYGGRRRTR